MVSPTLVSATVLIDAVRKPISPGPRSAVLVIFGEKTPTWSTWWVEPDDIMRIFWPFLRVPSITRTKIITPK